MSNEDTPHGGGTMVEDGGPDPRALVRLDDGHHIGTGGLPAVFENPGLPAHVHRLADDDEAAGKRAERQVATLFGVSMLGTLAFIVAYFAIDYTTVRLRPRHRQREPAPPRPRRDDGRSPCSASASASCTGPRR